VTRRRFPPIHPAFMAVLLAAAAVPAPAAAQAAAEGAVRYLCGDRTADVAYARHSAVLTVDGRRIPLAAAPSASGARFEAAGDPAASVHAKGDRAVVVVDGAELPECVEAPVFRATGNEPGWMAEIAGGRLTLLLDYGAARVEAEAERPGDDRWAVPRLGILVEVAARICRDDATGMPHPAAVRVSTPGGELRGCGGDPADLLAGEAWTVVEAGGAPVPAGAGAAVRFGADGRLSGSAGCNAITSAWRLTGEGLELGPVAATRRLCPPGPMQVEARVLDALRDVRRFDLGDDGALVLHGPSRPALVARR